MGGASQLIMMKAIGKAPPKKTGGKPITDVGHTAAHHNNPKGSAGVSGPVRTGKRIRPGSGSGLNIGGY